MRQNRSNWLLIPADLHANDQKKSEFENLSEKIVLFAHKTCNFLVPFIIIFTSISIMIFVWVWRILTIIDFRAFTEIKLNISY